MLLVSENHFGPCSFLIAPLDVYISYIVYSEYLDRDT